MRFAWQTVIGTALGASFTAELLARAQRLPLSIAGLFVATAGATAAASVVLRKGARYELPTSFFASVPGGLNDMTLIGGEMGGDERTIALSHTVRLVAVVSLLPVLMRSAWAPAVTIKLPALSTALVSPSITTLDAAILLACAAAGPLLGRALRLPARFLVGPLLLSALAHMAGTQARPPGALIAAAQVVVGAAVGCRFAGVRLGAMRVTIGWALVTTALQLSVCSACAAAMAYWTATPFPLLLLAYSPGGITELTLCAVALGMDSAFVATHHLMRILAITLGTPALFSLAGRVRDGLRSSRA
jgi:membrane AbrB-like protein